MTSSTNTSISKIRHWCTKHQATFHRSNGAIIVRLNNAKGVLRFNKKKLIGTMYRYKGNGPPGEYMTKKAALERTLRILKLGIVFIF